MTIKLIKGYFIETDDLQYILKQTYTKKDKSGNKVESIRTISYHRTLEQVIEKYITLLQKRLQPDRAVSLREYVDLVTRETREAVSAYNKLIEGTLKGGSK